MKPAALQTPPVQVAGLQLLPQRSFWRLAACVLSWQLWGRPALAVVLVAPVGPDPLLDEVASRLQAELVAEGQKVQRESARPLSPISEPLVEFEDGEVVITFPESSAMGPATVVRLSVPAVEKERQAAVLALRASEMLAGWEKRRGETDASSLPQNARPRQRGERSQPASRAQLASRAQSAPRAQPAPQVQPGSQVQPAPQGFFGQLAVGASVSGANGPLATFAGQFGWRASERWDWGVTVLADPEGARVASAAGSAVVRTHAGVVETRVLLQIRENWEVRLGPSAGLMLIEGRGTATSAERAFDRSTLAAGLGGGVAVFRSFAPLAFGAECRALFALPIPVVVVGDTSTAFARPLVSLSLVAEFRP